MNIQEGIGLVSSGKDLSQSEMYQIILDILNGGVTDAQIGAFLIALSMKGETVEEVIGAVNCLLYTSPSPRDRTRSRMPSSA